MQSFMLFKVLAQTYCLFTEWWNPSFQVNQNCMAIPVCRLYVCVYVSYYYFEKWALSLIIQLNSELWESVMFKGFPLEQPPQGGGSWSSLVMMLAAGSMANCHPALLPGKATDWSTNSWFWTSCKKEEKREGKVRKQGTICKLAW